MKTRQTNIFLRLYTLINFDINFLLDLKLGIIAE